MKVYIVTGHTGEYDDIQVWNAFAFKTEQAAIDKVAELHTLLEKQGLMLKTVGTLTPSFCREGRVKIRSLENGDIKFECDYTGSHYEYEELTLSE